MCKMTFCPTEVPVAATMLDLARKADQPVQQFVCYWTAFNNIYTTITERRGFTPRLSKKQPTRSVWGIEMPNVLLCSERDQLKNACDQFCDELKSSLINHPSAAFFFKRRILQWKDRALQADASGRPLNGVLNVARTIDESLVVWSPIVAETYETYVAGNRLPEIRDALASQILSILYCIRSNLTHATTLADEASNSEVVSAAIPLIQMIVSEFLPAYEITLSSAM